MEYEGGEVPLAVSAKEVVLDDRDRGIEDVLAFCFDGEGG